jgi:pyruvate,water dikinase
MTTFVRDFSTLSKADVAIAGGKGASLGEMTKAGIPVPPGFVVVRDAFDRFLEQTGLLEEIGKELAPIRYEDTVSIERASRIVQALIIDEEFPGTLGAEILEAFDALGAEFVAVRSSATAEDGADASWAGELESYLNTPRESLLQNVQKCWASLYSPRAIVYRNEKGMTNMPVSVAVVVQKMVQSEAAGISFTVHPVTKDRDQMIIEACWGLGEMIVGGMVTPDSYIVQKSTGEIIDVHQADQDVMLMRGKEGNTQIPVLDSSKQKLDEVQIRSIASICQTIEQHYGFPCDIEWAMEKGEFFIVQSRPITTL